MQQKLINLSLILITVLSIGYVVITTSKTGTQSNKNEIEISSEFMEFYEKFHSDTIFQLQRIDFPLKGVTFNESGIPINHEWEKSTWSMHKSPKSFNDYYETSLQPMGLLITEITQHKLYAFSMERRFAKINNQYQLIYYKSMGPN